MVGSHLPPSVPHARYTHQVIELTDGRCYCLACDEVVAEEYLGRGDRASRARPVRSEPSDPSTTGT